MAQIDFANEDVRVAAEQAKGGWRRGNLDAPDLEWDDTIQATKAHPGSKAVALCGFASTSRYLAPYDRRDIEIWGCNEAYNANYMKTSEGEFRADRWFQLHTEEDFTRANNINDKRHYEWLQQEHNFPIYMQAEFDSIPNSEKIPIDEMDVEYFSNVYTLNLQKGKTEKWLEENDHGYYSSSFAWMMAMAIYQGFEEIQIWGFNMGTQSEYMYQKPGGEFWVGVALALGIKVSIAGNSPILRGHLYGFEVSDVLGTAPIKKRMDELQAEIVEVKQQALQFHGARLELDDMLLKYQFDWLVDRFQTRSQQELAATCQVNFYQGAIVESTMYLNANLQRHGDPEGGWIDRLSLEVRKAQVRQQIEQRRGILDSVGGAKMEIKHLKAKEGFLTDEQQDILTERLDLLHNKEIEEANLLCLALGAISQIDQYIFQSEGRAPNMTEEHDYGFIIVPDLFPEDNDALNLTYVEEKRGQKKEEESEEDEGGTGGDLSISGESPQRPPDPSFIRRLTDGNERAGGGDWVSPTEGDPGGESGRHEPGDGGEV
jgi:hypothetical protein